MEHAPASTARRRGHQHHPRHSTRRRLETSGRGPAQCGPAGTINNINNNNANNNNNNDTGLEDIVGRTSDATSLGSHWLRDAISRRIGPNGDDDDSGDIGDVKSKTTSSLADTAAATGTTTTTTTTTSTSAITITTSEKHDGKEILDVQRRLAQCSPDVQFEHKKNDDKRQKERQRANDLKGSELTREVRLAAATPRGREAQRSASSTVIKDGGEEGRMILGELPEEKEEKEEKEERTVVVTEKEEFDSVDRLLEPEHAVARARGDGNSDDESTNVEEDPELVELAKLRCSSERAEVEAEREARRGKRCADYPGLAFGSSIFSSDTMMKFSLIKNELQNIMGNQLKRVSFDSFLLSSFFFLLRLFILSGSLGVSAYTLFRSPVARDAKVAIHAMALTRRQPDGGHPTRSQR